MDTTETFEWDRLTILERWLKAKFADKPCLELITWREIHDDIKARNPVLEIYDPGRMLAHYYNQHRRDFHFFIDEFHLLELKRGTPNRTSLHEAFFKKLKNDMWLWIAHNPDFTSQANQPFDAFMDRGIVGRKRALPKRHPKDDYTVTELSGNMRNTTNIQKVANTRCKFANFPDGSEVGMEELRFAPETTFAQRFRLQLKNALSRLFKVEDMENVTILFDTFPKYLTVEDVKDSCFDALEEKRSRMDINDPIRRGPLPEIAVDLMKHPQENVFDYANPHGKRRLLITDMTMAQGMGFPSVILIWSLCSEGQWGPLCNLDLSRQILSKANCILRAVCNLQIISLLDSRKH